MVLQASSLVKNIPHSFSCVSNHADGSDFLDRIIPAIGISASMATGTPRETCAFVSIFDDVFYEDEESFELDLLLDPSVPQSGVILDPNVTTIFITDNNGKLINNGQTLYVNQVP